MWMLAPVNQPHRQFPGAKTGVFSFLSSWTACLRDLFATVAPINRGFDAALAFAILPGDLLYF